MTQTAFDEIPEASIPANLQDGKTGDRVSVLETGVLYVRGGEASFAPWDTIYGVTELDGRLHILNPRPLPLAPWFTVHPDMVRGGAASLPQQAERIRRGPGGGGYRDAVRHHRARLSLDELIARVQERTPLAGGLTVPVQNVASSTKSGLLPLQFFLFGTGLVLGILLCIASVVINPQLILLGYLGGASIVFAGFCLAVAAGPVVGRFQRSLGSVRRVLVLAPDGCIVGLPNEVRALHWSDVARFRVVKGVGGTVLSIEGAGGVRVGAVQARFLGGPIHLIAAVANTYRDAAHG